MESNQRGLYPPPFTSSSTFPRTATTTTHRRPARRAGLRRHSSRTMREIIKALAESVGYLPPHDVSLDPPNDASHDASSIHPDERDRYERDRYHREAEHRQGTKTSTIPPIVENRFVNDHYLTADHETSAFTINPDGPLSEMPESSHRPTRIKLLRSQDLWVEPQVNTELDCDYCGHRFHLQDGGASFDGKAACGNCEQHLNRDIVLPAINKLRAQARETTDAANLSGSIRSEPKSSKPIPSKSTSSEPTLSDVISLEPTPMAATLLDAVTDDDSVWKNDSFT